MVLRHNAKYFLHFIEFVVDEELFRIPSVDSFTRHSLVLRPRIRAGEKQIDLTGSVSAREFEQFLEIILPLQVTSWAKHSITQWCLVLKLANTWQIEPLRKVAIQKIGWDDSIARIEQGHEYHVAQWVELGYTSFLQRAAPLTIAEAERLGWPVALRICHLREEQAGAKAAGTHRHGDFAARIGDVFADELKRIRDVCTWLSSEPEGIIAGPATMVIARALRPMPIRTMKQSVPKAPKVPAVSPDSTAPPVRCASSTPQPFTFNYKSPAPLVQSDTPSSFGGPPAAPVSALRRRDGEAAQRAGSLVDPVPCASQASLPFSLVNSPTNAPAGPNPAPSQASPIASAAVESKCPDAHASPDPLLKGAKPSSDSNDTVQANTPPVAASPLSAKMIAEAADIRKVLAWYNGDLDTQW
ncbi:hypothetical protein PC9H_001012 [Pleurotus ostreatus]|uniref:Uncharacterized protein n=1 Tax=Pleurotus ostreatus TaxID=5322 RepID=A0A8H7A235_PLEOS|nr:uncharacterized protein PC9H_001012 [Pleurotus ostreatus]KAF7440665.1 hypothetical protein PC9H_001012 [Pleurotus ostreatus]KAJ8699950.1 hypothetical protein PTI98_003023 [Pleurotus ostreatus]